MTDSNKGKLLRWVATRGRIHDWTIYISWAHYSTSYILDYGDKVTSKDNIKKLVPCDDEALNMYRY